MSAPGSQVATRGQSDMRGFGYPHDRLCVGSGASLEASVAGEATPAESRMLLALCGPARSAGVRSSMARSVLHDREAPAPAGGLPGDGRGGHRGTPAAGVEASPPAVQATARRLRTLAHQALCPSLRRSSSQLGWRAVRRCCHAASTSRRRACALPVLADGSLAAALAGGALAGREAEVGTERAPVEALPLADLGGQAEGGQRRDAAQAAEAGRRPWPRAPSRLPRGSPGRERRGGRARSSSPPAPPRRREPGRAPRSAARRASAHARPPGSLPSPQPAPAGRCAPGAARRSRCHPTEPSPRGDVHSSVEHRSPDGEGR